MKISNSVLRRWGAAMLCAVILIPRDGWAQQREERSPIRVRKVEWRRGESLVRTPDYRTAGGRGVGLPGEWWRFAVQYDTRPDWLDELTFQYYVLALGQVDGRKQYSFYQARVTYIDIERGRHTSDMFLRPNTIKRYGDPVAMTVLIFQGAEQVGEAVQSSIALPEKWWTVSDVINSELTATRGGYLLNRAETPFAFIDVDSYETIK